MDLPIRNYPFVATTAKKPSDEQGMLLNCADKVLGRGGRRESILNIGSWFVSGHKFKS